jgi:HEAT repeat protein
MYTLIALRSCVSDADLPVLRQMLFDRDHVTQLAAAGVLVDMGAGGRATLASALAAAGDVRAKSTIQDALREADDPQRRPLAAYPLDDRERRRIRGCGAFAR